MGLPLLWRRQIHSVVRVGDVLHPPFPTVSEDLPPLGHTVHPLCWLVSLPPGQPPLGGPPSPPTGRCMLVLTILWPVGGGGVLSADASGRAAVAAPGRHGGTYAVPIVPVLPFLPPHSFSCPWGLGEGKYARLPPPPPSPPLLRVVGDSRRARCAWRPPYHPFSCRRQPPLRPAPLPPSLTRSVSTATSAGSGHLDVAPARSGGVTPIALRVTPNAATPEVGGPLCCCPAVSDKAPPPPPRGGADC